MTSDRPRIDEASLARVTGRYPQLGEFRGIIANALSINTAACLFETDRGVHFAKRFNPRERDSASLLAEHAIILKLQNQNYPTPKLLVNDAGETLTWCDDQPYAIHERARGEDRYGKVPVFAPFETVDEARSAGAALARLHLILKDGPLPDPKPFRGITARYRLVAAPDLERGLEALIAEAPVLAGFLKSRPERAQVWGDSATRLAAIAPHLPELERGIIHGDFIKRNLFWQGRTVSDVLDFDLWNVEYLVYDLALSLLPCGFDWPQLLQGQGEPNRRDLRAFLSGYQSVRPLGTTEALVLPRVLESARVEFYLSIVARELQAARPDEAERFWRLLVETSGWFARHPGWDVVLG